MATITPIKRAKGTVYRVQARVKRKGKPVLTASQTFPRYSQADAWGKAKDIEFADSAQNPRLALAKYTVKDLIQKYIAEFCADAGRTKQQHLEQMLKFDFADLRLIDLTSDVLIDHARQRSARGLAPATVNNDFVWLRNVLKVAYPAWRIPVTLDELEAAALVCRKYKLISKSRARTRRPTDKELNALSEYFLSRDGRALIPMHDIMWFAIHSSRREAEICRLLHSDNIEKERSGLVRDLKHPRKKKGNHRRFKYTLEAWKIVERQPKVEGEDRIFPYNSKSVGHAFTQACKVLEIEDLRFHDLRHEATSRLFESKKKYTIPEVQMFTLHEDWNVLRRYTQLRPKNIT